MKANRLKERTLRAHFEIQQDFLASLAELFPDCGETKDVQLYLNNVVFGNETEMSNGVQAWVSNLDTPLKKGCAKYAKAVESITGFPATVYHAIAYRDVNAIAASTSSPTLARLDLQGKLESDAFDAESKDAFWQYMDELNKTAYEAMGKKAPSVPTRDDIQEDIARRKSKSSSSSSSSSSNETVASGILDGVQKLFALRKEGGSGDGSGLPFPAAEVVISRMQAKGDDTSSSPSSEPVSSRLRNRESDSFFEMMQCILPDHALQNKDPPTEEEWDLMNKVMGLVTMKSAIGENMMSGIEKMANRIVDDISKGKDLSSLNVENIGKEVLSSVNASDMTQFANNIDKLLPALSQFKPPNL